MKRKPVKGKSKSAARYKIYTRPDLYEDQRPVTTWAATWAVRLGIVLTMLGMVAIFHQPLHAALNSVFGA